jgi:hypothetical protein
MNQSLIRNASALAMLGLMGGTAFAADGFKLRYPFQGSLGGEIAAPLNQPGWFASLAVVGVDINKLSGPDGNERQLAFSEPLPMPDAKADIIASAVATATATATTAATAQATARFTAEGQQRLLSGADLTAYVAPRVQAAVASAVATATATATVQATTQAALVPVGTTIGSFDAKTTVKLSQRQTNAAFILGYAFQEMVGGGRIVATAQLPYTTELSRSLRTDAPVFNTTQAVGLQQQQADFLISSGIYNKVAAVALAQGRDRVIPILADFSKKNSANVSGQGDAEVTAAWAYQKDAVKVVAGMTVALPTGDYNSSVGLLGQAGVAGVNIGFGNYYTLRPGIAVAYSPSSDWTIGAKASYGINTRNKDNDIKSGDYVGIDLAAVYKTPIGVIGPHFIYVDQVKDDTYGARSVNQAQTFGANRFNMQGAGLVFTTIIPGTDAGLTLSYMTTMESKNALSGSFTMVRLTKKF